MVERFLRVAAAVAMFMAATGVGSAQPFPPFDEASGDPSFVEFRDKVREIARHGDDQALRSIMAPDIITSFGGDGGIDEAVAALHEPLLRKELVRVLDNGGRYEDGETFIAPYWYFADPGEDAQRVTIIGDDVPVHQSAADSTPVIGTLGRQTVDVASDGAWDVEGWVGVQLPDGGEGFVTRGLVRTPYDYRAVFTKQSGEWLLNAFVEGD